ncbi:flagellar hook assembly protein FlgD [Bacillus sp. 2205SS5-2]|uniref:flagellar hook assembly protein FlgD n=1 Tax=Bacillus sp. 2205SS5-2 TaxID=3109031 RepID=UPI0030051CE5
MTKAIDSNLLLSSYQAKQRETNGSILGKDDFLKILMSQLQNQDPMNPMQDKDFIAQMATFSSLEQMQNMGKSMDSFVDVQKQNQLISYNQFVGKTVAWHKVDEAIDSDSISVLEGSGKVMGIKFHGDSVEFTLEDGTKLTPANISEVFSGSTENSLVEASHLIGKKVSWTDVSGVEREGSVLSVSNKEGKIWIHFPDNKKIEVSQLTKIE